MDDETKQILETLAKRFTLALDILSSIERKLVVYERAQQHLETRVAELETRVN